MSAAPPELRDDLARLDVLLHREILRLRGAYQLSLDELRGLYVSDEQVDALLARARPADGDDSLEALTREADALAARADETSPITRLARELGLAPFERDVLLLAAAPELDTKYDTLYAYLNNHVARRHPTVSLALRLFGRDRPQARALLHRSARLFREALVEPVDPPADNRTDLASAFALAPAVTATLLGLPAFDARLAASVDTIEPDGAPLGAAAEAALAHAAGALRGRSDSPLIIIESEAAQAPAAAAAHLLAALGHATLRLDGATLPAERPLLASLALLARLRRAGLYLDISDWNHDNSQRLLPAAVATLARARVPLVLAIPPQQPWRPFLRGLPALRVVLDAPEPAERRALWSAALARAAVPADAAAIAAVSERFRLGPSQIASAAAALALDRPAAAFASAESVLTAARAESAGDLDKLAAAVPRRHAWADLVLPPVIVRRLRELAGAIRSRATVFGEWGFGARSGRGLMALFSGASGTGKTMSASVIARDLGLDLHRVDLASVVSKYIGETEKNLARVFDAARAANSILFFDEADALLGRRSEVKDAHDRYANIEVAFLLQRMEDHDGVVILASNLAKNIDQAFTRRMHYVVEFPRPDAPLRERLWRRIFPPAAPLAADVDFAFLARQFDLTGGDIKTTALDAAFLAAGQGRGVTMSDLVGAVARQLIKQGRPLASSDFKQWHGRIGGAVEDAADDGAPVAPPLAAG
jgi:hypothetical protein